MLDAAIQDSLGIKVPTSYEIGHICVEKEYEDLKIWAGGFKRIWKERGCTLMCDEWTTIRKRHFVNFLAYSLLGMVFIDLLMQLNMFKMRDILIIYLMRRLKLLGQSV